MMMKVVNQDHTVRNQKLNRYLSFNRINEDGTAAAKGKGGEPGDNQNITEQLKQQNASGNDTPIKI